MEKVPIFVEQHKRHRINIMVTVACLLNHEVWDRFGTKQFEFDFRHQLQSISIPAVVLTCEDDPEHPHEFAYELANALNTEPTIIESAGAPAYLDQKEETLAKLREHITQILRENASQRNHILHDNSNNKQN